MLFDLFRCAGHLDNGGYFWLMLVIKENVYEERELGFVYQS